MKEGGNFVNPVSNDIPHGLEGLSKREYFAALVMQGIASEYKNHTYGHKIAAEIAVTYADALLKQLKKPE